MKGRHSEIEFKNGVALKKFHPQFKYNFWKELAFLNILQPFSFVPKLYGFNRDRLEIEMECINGRHIESVITDISPEHLGEILDACRTLDRLSIQKEEMTHPYKHIIIGERIVFVDFERSVIKERPSNLTQFLVYLNSRRKIMNRDELISITRDYKKSFSEKMYADVKERVLSHIE